jgi:hypothetical protein
MRQLDIVVHACNPRIRETEASLDCIARPGIKEKKKRHDAH